MRNTKRFVGLVASTTGLIAILGVVYAYGPVGHGFGDKSGAKICFEDVEQSLGLVPQWQNQVTVFEFVNEGTADLEINPKVFMSDSSATATVNPTSIAPGEKGEVRLTVDPGDLEGKHKVFGVIRTNDPNLATVTLCVSMELEARFLVTPRSVTLGAITSGEEIEDRVIRVRWNKSRKVEITGVECTEPRVHLSRIAVDDERGQGADIKVSIDPIVARSQTDFQETFRAIIRINTTHDSYRNIVVPVTATLERFVTLSPRILQLGALGVGERLSDALDVRATGSTPFQVTSFECDSEFIRTSLEVVEPGLHYRIRLDILPTEVLGPVEAMVTIETDAEFCESLGCRIVGVINP